MEVLRLVKEVGVEVGVHAKFNREIEHDVDVPVRVGVVVRHAAHQIGAGPQRLTQEGLGTGGLQNPLLGKGAELQVDRRGVLALQRGEGLEAHQPNDRIDLRVAPHRGGALAHRHIQHAASPRLDVLAGEPALGLAGHAEGLGQRAFPARCPLAQQRLVEMDVGIHQPRRHRAALAADLARGRALGERADLRDEAGAATDVGHPGVRQPAVAQQQIETSVRQAPVATSAR